MFFKSFNRPAFLSSLCVLAASLAACGGGGGGGTSSPTTSPSTNDVANVFPMVAPGAGDFLVLKSTQVATVGPAAEPEYSISQYVDSSSPLQVSQFDSRSGGASSSNYKTTFSLTSDLKEASTSSLGLICSNNPAFSVAPSKGAAPGSTYSMTSVRSCNSGIAPENLSVTGTAIGLEDITTQAGTFKAFKYTYTLVRAQATAGYYEYTSTGSVWVDTATGRDVKSIINTRTKVLPTNSITADVTQTIEAIAYSAQGRSASAPSVRRFAGGWNATYYGAASGSCSLTVVDVGGVYGQCSGGTSPSVSGNVTASGALSLTLSDGSTMTGSLTSPGSGSGVWALGVSNGTWTASHK